MNIIKLVSSKCATGIFNNVNAGTATVAVTDPARGTFTILPKIIVGLSVDAIPAQDYTGQAVIPAVTVRDGGRILTAG
jgi:hypothetical protein